jgi:putative SOS response-associated peptidase YedK
VCGRYWIELAAEEELRKIIEAALLLNPLMKTAGEVFPGDFAPVIARNRRLERAAFPMLWGFPVFKSKSVINIRGETAGEKPAFQNSARERRCAIPASWYFEWAVGEGGKKVKYRFFDRDGKTLYLAGLYTLTQNGAGFAIITRPAAGIAAAVHHRMPAIVPADALGDWIFGGTRLELLVYGAAMQLEFDLAEPEKNTDDGAKP